MLKSDREHQEDILAGLSPGRWDVTGYVFNPDESRPAWVLAVGFGY